MANLLFFRSYRTTFPKVRSFAFLAGICYTTVRRTRRRTPRRTADPIKEGLTMKFLKALLAVLTCLAVTLTGVLLFVDKRGPHYIQIDNSED